MPSQDELRLRRNDTIGVYVIGLVFITFCLMLIWVTGKPENVTNNCDNIDSSIEHSQISEHSTSMRPEVQPYMRVVKVPFKQNDNLMCGHLYTYKDGNKSIIHRFVYENEKGNLFFKGDNNKYYDDPINRSVITHKVVSLIYR